jgi:hypothetical protein
MGDGDELIKAFDPALTEALTRVPAPTDRGANIVVPSSKATEAELDDIELAIDHPPKPADHFGTAVSVLGALGLILKTSITDRYGLPTILAAAALGAIQIARYASALLAPTPLKSVAKKHIRRLKVAQGWKPEEEQPSNWRKLRLFIWARLFEFFAPPKEMTEAEVESKALKAANEKLGKGPPA